MKPGDIVLWGTHFGVVVKPQQGNVDTPTHVSVRFECGRTQRVPRRECEQAINVTRLRPLLRRELSRAPSARIEPSSSSSSSSAAAAASLLDVTDPPRLPRPSSSSSSSSSAAAVASFIADLSVDPAPTLPKQGQPSAIEHLADLTEVNQYIECPVCLVTMKDPMSAKCGHIYCKSCMVEFIENNILCPMCKEPLEEVQSNFFLAGLIEIILSASAPKQKAQQAPPPAPAALLSLPPPPAVLVLPLPLPSAPHYGKRTVVPGPPHQSSLDGSWQQATQQEQLNHLLPGH